MPEVDSRVKQILGIFDQMQTDRRMVDTFFDEVGDYVSPNRHIRHGERRFNRKRTFVYDNTAQEAAKELSALIHGLLNPQSSLWINLVPSGAAAQDKESIEWSQQVELMLYGIFNSPNTGFYSTRQETLQDRVSFGTSCKLVLEDTESIVKFSSIPPVEIYIAENSGGRVDRLVRRFDLTATTAADLWGAENLSEKVLANLLSDKADTEKTEYLHYVGPRSVRNIRLSDKFNKPFASFYIDRKNKHIVAEGGFNEFPYQVSRWSKTSGEVFGDPPAGSFMDEIKMTSTMRKADIISKEKAGSPTIIVEDNSVIGPLVTHPNSVIYKRRGSDPITTLPTGDSRINEETIRQQRESIRQVFFLDRLVIPQLDRMTAFEVAERRRDSLQIMSPFIARDTEEDLAPTINRVLAIMNRRGLLPPLPVSLQEEGMSVEYVSPLAISQKAGEVQSVQAWFALLSAAAQFDPNAFSAVDFDELAQGTSISLNVPQRYVKDLEQVRAQRQQDEQQSQLAQAAQTGGDIAGAVKTAVEAGAGIPI